MCHRHDNVTMPPPINKPRLPALLNRGVQLLSKPAQYPSLLDACLRVARAAARALASPPPAPSSDAPAPEPDSCTPPISSMPSSSLGRAADAARLSGAVPASLPGPPPPPSLPPPAPVGVVGLRNRGCVVPERILRWSISQMPAVGSACTTLTTHAS